MRDLSESEIDSVLSRFPHADREIVRNFLSNLAGYSCTAIAYSEVEQLRHRLKLNTQTYNALRFGIRTKHVYD